MLNRVCDDKLFKAPAGIASIQSQLTFNEMENAVAHLTRKYSRLLYKMIKFEAGANIYCARQTYTHSHTFCGMKKENSQHLRRHTSEQILLKRIFCGFGQREYDS